MSGGAEERYIYVWWISWAVYVRHDVMTGQKLKYWKAEIILWEP